MRVLEVQDYLVQRVYLDHLVHPAAQEEMLVQEHQDPQVYLVVHIFTINSHHQLYGQ